MGRQEPPHVAPRSAGAGLRRGWLLLLAGLLGSAWGALRPGDPALAAHAWETAQLVHGDALTHPFYLYVAETQADVAPWQPGFAEARSRLRAIGAARRAALPHDRGARRDALAER